MLVDHQKHHEAGQKRGEGLGRAPADEEKRPKRGGDRQGVTGPVLFGPLGGKTPEHARHEAQDDGAIGDQHILARETGADGADRRLCQRGRQDRGQPVGEWEQPGKAECERRAGDHARACGVGVSIMASVMWCGKHGAGGGVGQGGFGADSGWPGLVTRQP